MKRYGNKTPGTWQKSGNAWFFLCGEPIEKVRKRTFAEKSLGGDFMRKPHISTE
jgi:hypothetical protein